MILLVFATPLLLVLLSSFKTPAEAMQSPPTFLPQEVSLENYLGLEVGGHDIWHYLLNTVVVTAGTVALTLVVATPAAYGFSKHSFPGSRLMLGAMLGAIIIPFQVLLTPLFLVLKGVGLNNSLLGLVLVYTTFQLPFSIYLLKTSFDAVPNSIIEAAHIDGAGNFRCFWTMLPLAKAAVATVAIFAFSAAWNEFIAALILLGDQSKFTMPILLTTLTSGHMGSIDWGVLQAGVVLTIVPCTAVFVLLQKYYASGLTAGAVKA
jgi:multiple sugar transport system permease protein